MTWHSLTDDNGVYLEGKYFEMVDGVALVAPMER